MWRKLHLAVDADTGMVMASTLTGNEVGDPSQVAPLLDQIEATIASVTADGAYDGMPTYDVVAGYGEDICVIIPPHVTAVPSVVRHTDGHLCFERARLQSCRKRPKMNWALQAAEKLDFSKSAKNGSRQDAPGTIREGWLMVFHPPILAISPPIRSFSAACLAPEGCTF